MLLLENSIYESRMGFPVYYHHNNGYVPATPPYSQWEQQTQQGFTKSDRESQPLVYPQFPTPPLSVSPVGSRYNTPSPQPTIFEGTSSNVFYRPGESFQIKRLLNLEEEKRISKMRTASVIMKIEDQRVFQVDSTTAALVDESSFDSSNESAVATDNLFVCKWEKCYK